MVCRWFQNQVILSSKSIFAEIRKVKQALADLLMAGIKLRAVTKKHEERERQKRTAADSCCIDNEKL